MVSIPDTDAERGRRLTGSDQRHLMAWNFGDGISTYIDLACASVGIEIMMDRVGLSHYWKDIS